VERRWATTITVIEDEPKGSYKTTEDVNIDRSDLKEVRKCHIENVMRLFFKKRKAYTYYPCLYSLAL
jgi:hypothetical protein